MKASEIGSARNIGNPARWVVFVLFIAALAAPTLRYEPWNKMSAFYMKVYGDQLKDKVKK